MVEIIIVIIIIFTCVSIMFTLHVGLILCESSSL